MNTFGKASLMALGMAFVLICILDAVTPQSILKSLSGQSAPKANVTVVVNKVDDQPVTVRLSNQEGQVIASQELGGGNTVQFALKEAKNGTYQIEVTDGVTTRVKEVTLSAQKAA